MKHILRVTILLLVIFLVAQFLGLAILYKYIDQDKSQVEGKTIFKDLPIGERPPIEEGISYIPIILALLLGTGIFLLLIKYQWIWVMRIWFLLAVVFALTMAFGSVLSALVSFILALILGLWKLFKPNFWIHNFTELFIYGGLAVIFVPIFNIFSGIVLLVLIAIYDAYAVWKSKHMIYLAKSQTKAKLFAGLLIPYKIGKPVKSKGKQKTVKVNTAMLGGGDIGFPLIFAGIVLKEIGLWQSLVIPLFAALGLGLLLFNSKQKKFYPAMPFISAGCFLGLAVVWLIGVVVW